LWCRDKLQVAGYKLQVTGHRLQAASHRSQATSYRGKRKEGKREEGSKNSHKSQAAGRDNTRAEVAWNMIEEGSKKVTSRGEREVKEGSKD
jgi:hypothetical protein